MRWFTMTVLGGVVLAGGLWWSRRGPAHDGHPVEATLASPVAADPGVLPRIVDELGAPIAGAAIRIAARVPSPAGGWAQVPIAGEWHSDAQGGFCWPLPAPVPNPWLTVVREGRIARRIRGVDCLVEPLVLEAGASLVVTVRAGHDPIAGARVSATAPGMIPAVGFSDARGDCHPGGLPVGIVLRLSAAAPGRSVHEVRFTATQPTGHALDLALQDGRSLTGRIVDGETGRPVVAARVGVVGGVAVATDADGSFRLSGLLDEAVDVDVSAAGYVSIGGQAVGPGDGPIELRMRRASQVTGSVVDAAGAPIEGAWVMVMPIGSSASALWRALPERIGAASWLNVDDASGRVASGVFTDATGGFAIDGIDPSAPVRVSWSESGEALPATRDLTTTGEPQRHELLLQVSLAPAVLAGRVTLNGAATRATVAWRCGDRRGAVASEQTGDYRLEGLPGGELEVEVMNDSPPIARRFVVRLAPRRVVRRDFAIEADLWRIAGRVSDVDGQPLAARIVARSAATGTEVPATTDAQGRFELRCPPAAPREAFDLTVIAGARRTIAFAIVPGTDGVEIVLR